MGKIRKKRRTKRRPSPKTSTTSSSEEPKKTAMEKPLPLYLADDFDSLSLLVQNDVIKGLKNIPRLPGAAHRMLSELLQIQNDQERVYIIGKRYLKVMDHLFAHTEDKNFVEIRYRTEYRQVLSLIRTTEEELKARYEQRAKMREDEKMMKEMSGSAGSEESERVYISPEKPLEKGLTKPVRKGVQIFTNSEITPVELFNALMKKENMLIVDTRSSDEFNESHIVVDEGHLINIPGDIVVPGLSANTLGQRLFEDVQKTWNKRDTFDAIILLDWDTDKFNYSGSRLERVRNCIVEWDFNRVYPQEPVILKGGFKEFLEWYPSEVTNSQAYLSQTNSEIDDLLTIDDISYPEAGSGVGNMNLKVHTISSFGDVQARIERDFGDMEITPGPPARPSRSEGQLPKDFYSSQKVKSPYRSLSEESIPKDYFNLEPPPEPEPFFEFDPKKEEPSFDFKSAIEGDRAELLEKARALKPKTPSSPRADPKEVIIRNLIEENKGLFVVPKAPAVDRTFKPAQVQPGMVGEGYTGIKNLRNNCYVSCILQCLKVLPLIKSMFVTSNSYIKHIHKQSPVITIHFAMVMKHLWEGTPKRPASYYPQAFLDKIYDLNNVYAKGNHEDTFEFFIFLFNHLSEDCSFELPRPKIMTEREKSWYSQLQGRSSYFIDLTYYQLRNTKVCWSCQKPNYVFDNDSTVMLPVPSKRDHATLEELLKEYLKENLVMEYSCSECKCSATIVNRKEIVLDPEILIIVLKRYVANNDGTFSKNELDITFPEEMLEFGKSYYKLYAIPQHSGSMSVGHYYASVLLNDAKNAWVLFNDTKITKYNCAIGDVPGIKTSCVGFFYVRQKEKPDAEE